MMYCRIKTLRTTILFQESIKIIKTFNCESQSEIIAKINGMSEAKKDLISDCFINLAKFDFRI